MPAGGGIKLGRSKIGGKKKTGTTAPAYKKSAVGGTEASAPSKGAMSSGGAGFSENDIEFMKKAI